MEIYVLDLQYRKRNDGLIPFRSRQAEYKSAGDLVPTAFSESKETTSKSLKQVVSRMDDKSSTGRGRDPSNTNAWLIGSGIASLSAAVHLINDAQVPGSHIHILDRHDQTGGGITSSGDANTGFIINPGSLPYFHDECVENLLSLVPSTRGSKKSLLDSIRNDELSETPRRARTANTRFVRNRGGKSESSAAKQLSIGPYNRLQLMKVLLESENMLGRHRIQDYFGDDFFGTDFWTLWSTT